MRDVTRSEQVDGCDPRRGTPSNIMKSEVQFAKSTLYARKRNIPTSRGGIWSISARLQPFLQPTIRQSSLGNHPPPKNPEVLPLLRQTAAHRHPPGGPPRPPAVRRGPISACGAPRPSAQRAEAVFLCGCLAAGPLQGAIPRKGQDAQ